MSLDPAKFPHAENEGYTKTSSATKAYNCIAYAAGDDTRNWWPNSAPNGYWPENVPQRETVYAFLECYRSLGYETCDNGQLEGGFDKVAIYALNNVVTHAALQLQTDGWTSKVGWNIDIDHHTLEALEGPFYGQVVRFLRRAIQDN